MGRLETISNGSGSIAGAIAMLKAKREKLDQAIVVLEEIDA